jgi:hypothetical protein
MVSSSSIRWPRWQSVNEAWRSASVPDVRILPFDLHKHNANLPWFDLKQNDQVGIGDNPLDATACHLSVHILKAPEDLRVAYKLYAFCRENAITEFPHCVLQPIFEKHDEKLYGWWHSNARRVLPWYDDINALHNRERRDLSWREILQAAAVAWTQIAERWAVIRIPRWMDRNSAEYQAYERHSHELSEQRERCEYERLKKKFERPQ